LSLEFGVWGARLCRGGLQFHRKRISNSQFSGNEVYCTNSLLLLIKIMLCSKLHCQRDLN
jgi:hypothetical protein